MLKASIELFFLISARSLFTDNLLVFYVTLILLLKLEPDLSLFNYLEDKVKGVIWELKFKELEQILAFIVTVAITHPDSNFIWSTVHVQGINVTTKMLLEVEEMVEATVTGKKREKLIKVDWIWNWIDNDCKHC